MSKDKCGECGQTIIDPKQFHNIDCCNSFKAGEEKEKAHWRSQIETQVHDAYEGGKQAEKLPTPAEMRGIMKDSRVNRLDRPELRKEAEKILLSYRASVEKIQKEWSGIKEDERIVRFKKLEESREKYIDQLLALLDEADNDSQAREVGWYIERGWIPPGEVERLKGSNES